MASINEEITRIATAKSDIEDAIEECGVDVPDTELISTYADYIRTIPSAVLSGLNVDEIGGEGQYIKKISLRNGVIDAEAAYFTTATTSAPGLMSAADKSKLDSISTTTLTLADLGGISTILLDINSPLEFSIEKNGTIATISGNIMNANHSTFGVVKLHSANDCTTYSSDSGGAVTPAAVKKAVGLFVEVTQTLKSGTEIGTITVNGTSTTLYCTNSSSGDYIPLSGSDRITGTLEPYTDGDYDLGAYNYRWNDIYAHNIYSSEAFYQDSDKKLKTNIQTIPNNILDKVYNTKEVKFTWKESNKDSFGYIALDYEKISDVFINKSEDSTLSLDYTKVLVVQIAALKLKIADLESRIKVLEHL